ncbi:hypothetical protein OS493_018592 [Desmophyllum pertusum]|uniref:Uncharacterized protein n=1 Tax=Desmophyllum pertusum TaxID=174260 RepID=A0A9W9ZP20_9CNID|nr:hypothetical protein OS493_018592 [Desmophyllum pertusum]
MALLIQKIHDYLQRELEEFNKIYEDNTAVELHTDPAFIADIKGEEPVPGTHCPQKTSENVESRHVTETTLQNNNKAGKEKKNTSTNKKRNKRRMKTHLRMQPPPVEELVLRKDSFITTEKVTPRSPQVMFSGINAETTLAADQNNHDCYESYSPNSASKDSKAMAIETLPVTAEQAERGKHLDFLGIAVNVVTNGLAHVAQKLYAYAQSELKEFNTIYTGDVPYADPAFIACIKGEDTVPCTSSPHVTFVNSASNDSVHVATSAPLAQCKTEKVKPRLIPAHAHIAPRVNKAQDQTKTSPGVARSRQVWSANATSGNSKVTASQSNGKSSAVKAQVVLTPTYPAGVKRQKNKDKCKQVRFSDVVTVKTFISQTSAKSVASEFELAACTIQEPYVNVQMPEETTTRQPELMEVADEDNKNEDKCRQVCFSDVATSNVNSVGSEVGLAMPVVQVPRVSVQMPEETTTGQPELMKVADEAMETNQGLAQCTWPAVFNSITEEEPMEVHYQEPCENATSLDELDIEEMETNQESVSVEVLTNVMQSLRVQPIEEIMETNEESLPATPSIIEQETMEANREPIAMERQEAMEANQELVDACKPLPIPFSNPAVAKKPLAFTAAEANQVTDACKPVPIPFSVPAVANKQLAFTAAEANQELVDACKPVTIPFSHGDPDIAKLTLPFTAKSTNQLEDDLPDYPDYEDEPDDWVLQSLKKWPLKEVEIALKRLEAGGIYRYSNKVYCGVLL